MTNRAMRKVLIICSTFVILLFAGIGSCASAQGMGGSQKLPPNDNFNRGEAAVRAKRFTEAASWYRKSAEEGYVRGQNRLGICYLHGSGVPKNYEKAVALYRKAADKGFAPAQFNLALCYKDARGVPKSYEKAVTWYRKGGPGTS